MVLSFEETFDIAQAYQLGRERQKHGEELDWPFRGFSDEELYEYHEGNMMQHHGEDIYDVVRFPAPHSVRMKDLVDQIRFLSKFVSFDEIEVERRWSTVEPRKGLSSREFLKHLHLESQDNSLSFEAEADIPEPDERDSWKAGELEADLYYDFSELERPTTEEEKEYERELFGQFMRDIESKGFPFDIPLETDRYEDLDDLRSIKFENVNFPDGENIFSPREWYNALKDDEFSISQFQLSDRVVRDRRVSHQYDVVAETVYDEETYPSKEFKFRFSMSKEDEERLLSRESIDGSRLVMDQ